MQSLYRPQEWTDCCQHTKLPSIQLHTRTHACTHLLDTPVWIRAVLDNHELQFGESAKWYPVSTCHKLEELLLLVLRELMHHLPEVPRHNSSRIRWLTPRVHKGNRLILVAYRISQSGRQEKRAINWTQTCDLCTLNCRVSTTQAMESVTLPCLPSPPPPSPRSRGRARLIVLFLLLPFFCSCDVLHTS